MDDFKKVVAEYPIFKINPNMESNVKTSSTGFEGTLDDWHRLILLTLGNFIAYFILDIQILPFLVFFLGVWGIIETGRFLEAWMTKSPIKTVNIIGGRNSRADQ